MAKLKISHQPDYPTLVNEYEYLHIFKIIDEKYTIPYNFGWNSNIFSINKTA